MKSCLYECHVMHARFSPRAHRFLYRIFLFAIDLDELEALPRQVKFFSRERRNLYSFRERDYLPTNEPMHSAGSAGVPPASADAVATPALPLKQRVEAYAAAHGVDISGGRVVLVTLPRVAGYLFNPVSFYFCTDRHGAPAAAIAEVTNTFREVKPYFLGTDTWCHAAAPSSPEGSSSAGAPGASAAGPAAFHLRVPKHFYVSPYSDVDVAFDFVLRLPEARLSIQIDDYVGTDRTLTSTLTGIQRPLTSGRLAWLTIKYPLITLRVISLIHWHAFLLWLKRVPWFSKSARAAEQRELYRPHQSLQPSDAA
ncbi:DUF1365 domain-containing protein [Horticoccus sp. 23ND18S-11]|uniref:DUF1365 domain-containing protein n=1 Tax=Horticoccus sp. 23ND18S-11 TaxID=3391832 RepID=UPI0039C8F16B